LAEKACQGQTLAHSASSLMGKMKSFMTLTAGVMKLFFFVTNAAAFKLDYLVPNKFVPGRPNVFGHS
jgi:hypothetical protein